MKGCPVCGHEGVPHAAAEGIGGPDASDSWRYYYECGNCHWRSPLTHTANLAKDAWDLRYPSHVEVLRAAKAIRKLDLELMGVKLWDTWWEDTPFRIKDQHMWQAATVIEELKL